MIYNVMMYPRIPLRAEKTAYLWIQWHEQPHALSEPIKLLVPFPTHEAAIAEYYRLSPLRSVGQDLALEQEVRRWQMEAAL